MVLLMFDVLAVEVVGHKRQRYDDYQWVVGHNTKLHVMACMQ
jgi:hypothetical protein